MAVDGHGAVAVGGYRARIMVLAQEELTLRTRVQGLHSRAVLTALLLSGWPWDSCGR